MSSKKEYSPVKISKWVLSASSLCVCQVFLSLVFCPPFRSVFIFFPPTGVTWSQFHAPCGHFCTMISFVFAQEWAVLFPCTWKLQMSWHLISAFYSLLKITKRAWGAVGNEWSLGWHEMSQSPVYSDNTTMLLSLHVVYTSLILVASTNSFNQPQLFYLYLCPKGVSSKFTDSLSLYLVPPDRPVFWLMDLMGQQCAFSALIQLRECIIECVAGCHCYAVKQVVV